MGFCSLDDYWLSPGVAGPLPVQEMVDTEYILNATVEHEMYKDLWKAKWRLLCKWSSNLPSNIYVPISVNPELVPISSSISHR